MAVRVPVRPGTPPGSATIPPWAGIPGGMGRLLTVPRPPGMPQPGNYAVTACFWSLLVIWMLRGLAASWTGMVRVSTPAA